MATDYGGIVAGVYSALAGASSVTSLLASYTPDGGTASQANSIFIGTPPKNRAFPCITFLDLVTGPVVRRQHEVPFKYVAMQLQIDVWCVSEDGRAITWAIDNLLEYAFQSGAMDTTDWKFNDIDTSDSWRKILVPSEYVSGSAGIYQHSKSFELKAASKN